MVDRTCCVYMLASVLCLVDLNKDVKCMYRRGESVVLILRKLIFCSAGFLLLFIVFLHCDHSDDDGCCEDSEYKIIVLWYCYGSPCCDFYHYCYYYYWCCHNYY